MCRNIIDNKKGGSVGTECFLLKIGIFSVSAGAYLAIMIILNIVINPANI